ncbi:2,3-diaminopropionate biosynthesis protein SbnB [Streptomyces sp. NPDC059076]|uniref:2,3-diaminopropionate biosynthesis protein SbnB n=1 Tax=unclassified Streptomyces TaxID=2593676 RepID=UPI0036AB8007
MPDTIAAPSFSVISGFQVRSALEHRHQEIVDLVEATYRGHGAGDTVNPPSYFLRFPDRPASRIIALPASLGGQTQVDGIKWISSFPENLAAGIPRASAVLILNDHDTGYPFACLESSIISATRTAASAALAAAALTEPDSRPRRIGFFGAGLIARYVHEYLKGTGWSFDEYGVFDLSADHASGYADYLGRSTEDAAPVRVYGTPEELLRGSDLLVFATTAGSPHVTNPDWLSHNPVVLHLSLRDLSPEIVLASTNVVDDVDHCLKEGTSLHLAEQRVNHRDFVHGTLDEVLTGFLSPVRDRPLIFSPFGLGVLDLAVGKNVYDTLRQAGKLEVVDDFFHEMLRYG